MCTTSCTATPNSELMKSISSSLSTDKQADGGRTLVVEEGGLPVTLGLRVKDPFRRDGCTFKDPECMVDAGVNCSKQDSVYCITCDGCQENVFQGPNPLHMPRSTDAGGETRLHYIGMTGTSLHCRGKSHLAAVKRLDRSNALAHHLIDRHAGEKQPFTMKMCTSNKTVLNRYKSEAIFIEYQISGSSLNDRIEGGRGGLIRMDTRVERM